MFSLAERAQADIVIGKVVSNGRRVPHHLFARDVESTSIAELPLENSLTPHKMFRRSMLLEHDIWFPVTKRLEDQPFVLRSYFAARNVAIVGSYPCYHFTKRDDGANLSYSYLDPVLYYDKLRAIIDIVEEATEPGPLRDRILRRSYRSEIIGRVSEPGFLELGEADRLELVTHAKAVAEERFSPAIVDGLRPITRIRAALLQQADERGLTTFAEAMTGIEAWAQATDVVWNGSALRFDLRAGLVTADGSPLVFMEVDGDLHLDPRIDLPALGLDQRRLGELAEVDKLLRCDVYLTERGHCVEWGQSSSFGVELVEFDGDSPELPDNARLVQPVLVGQGQVTPRRVGASSRSGPGVWEISARITLSGLGREMALTLGEGAELPDPVWTGKPPHLLVPFVTGSGQLSIDVNGGNLRQTDRLTGRRLTAKLVNETVRVKLPFPAAEPVQAARRSTAELVLSRKKHRVVLPARLRPTATGAVVATASLARLERQPGKGTWAVSVGLEPGGDCHLPAGSVELPPGTATPATDPGPADPKEAPTRRARRLIGSLTDRIRGG